MVLLALAPALAAGCGSRTQVPAGGMSHSAGRSAGHSASPSPSPSCGASSGPAFPTAPRGESLNAVQFVSASVGWAVGSDRILHTADAGLHWATQFRTGRKAGLAAVDFTDARHGWVAGAAMILATTDGGAHWHALPEPCEPVRAVHFVSPADGFAVAGGSQPYLGVPASGGVLLATSDGGEHWRHVPSPPDVQTACFSDTRRGWLGAGGNIYGTTNGGRTWTLAVRRQHPGGSPGYSVIAKVECAGPGAAWAELIGPGAAMSHEPQIGYHTFGRTWQPIFAQQFFPHPGVDVRAEAPGVYPGPFSAISTAQAVFIGWCPPCSVPASPRPQGGTAPMDIATQGGAVLLHRGVVARLAEANGAAFVSADDGWVVGTQTRYPLSGRGHARTVSRIMHTADGGRTWQVQYTLGP